MPQMLLGCFGVFQIVFDVESQTNCGLLSFSRRPMSTAAAAAAVIRLPVIRPSVCLPDRRVQSHSSVADSSCDPRTVRHCSYVRAMNASLDVGTFRPSDWTECTDSPES